MHARRWLVATLMASLALCGATKVASALSKAEVTETSIRAEGMGGATTAVTWAEPGIWGNPAALARTRGIAWLEGRGNLLPGSADLRYDTRRFLIGTSGVGLSLMGEPDGFGRAKLSYNNFGTDPFGNPIVYESGEEVRAWGIGISPVHLLDAIRALAAPDAPSWARWGDVSFGYQKKRTKVRFGFALEDVEGENSDWGVVGRVAPLPGSADGRSPVLALSFGHARINADEEAFYEFSGGGRAGAPTRVRRTGVGVHAVLPFGADADGASSPWSWWLATVPSAIELGVAYDREEHTYPTFFGPITDEAHHWGFEASIMQILVGRLGYVEDRAVDAHDVSVGLGVHLPIGAWGRVEYAWATRAPSGYSDRVNRHGIAVWLHPAAIWSSSRSDR